MLADGMASGLDLGCADETGAIEVISFSLWLSRFLPLSHSNILCYVAVRCES